MKKTLDLSTYVSKAMQHKDVHGFTIHVHHQGKDHSESQGNLKGGKRFFAASVTKLLVTALMLKLMDEGKTSLDDHVTGIIGDILPEGFHTYKGVDYTKALRVRHLMSNTSGLPDYFDKPVMARLLDSQDETWGLHPVIDYVKDKPAHFPPGHKCKAKYCDTNYQLLGAIIERLSGKTFSEKKKPSATAF